jgi:hypothetical protein
MVDGGSWSWTFSLAFGGRSADDTTRLWDLTTAHYQCSDRVIS